MPFAGQFLQDVLDRSAGTKGRTSVDAESLCELVGSLKADAPDVGSKPIWIGPHQLDRPLAVALIDSHGPSGADPVRLKKENDGPHGLLLAPAFANALDPARSYSLDFPQKRGAFVNNR